MKPENRSCNYLNQKQTSPDFDTLFFRSQKFIHGLTKIIEILIAFARVWFSKIKNSKKVTFKVYDNNQLCNCSVKLLFFFSKALKLSSSFNFYGTRFLSFLVKKFKTHFAMLHNIRFDFYIVKRFTGELSR
jgi:hypothetical protein